MAFCAPPFSICLRTSSGSQSVGKHTTFKSYEGFAAHGIYIAQGICRSYFAEVFGRIDNGGYEIHRQDTYPFFIDLPQRGVLAPVPRGNKAFIPEYRKVFQ